MRRLAIEDLRDSIVSYQQHLGHSKQESSDSVDDPALQCRRLMNAIVKSIFPRTEQDHAHMDSERLKLIKETLAAYREQDLQTLERIHQQIAAR